MSSAEIPEPNRAADVLTLGRVLVDLYANELHTPLKDVTSFNKYLGGSAGNTAVGLARLGARAGLISRVGKDDFGAFLLEQLEREGVDRAMVRVDPRRRTALAFAAIFPPGDSHVLFYRKPCADVQLDLADLDRDRIAEARLLVVAATALAEPPARDAALAALQMHRSAGGINVIDVDWRPTLWEDHAAARLYYRVALREADIVLANETELEFAGGSADPETAASAILALGPRQVVAKRGEAGVWLFGEGGPLHVPPFRVEVVNTLGAGDAFGAGFCLGLLRGWPMVRCLTYGAATGAIVVSRHSCSAAMPTREEVDRLIAEAGRG